MNTLNDITNFIRAQIDSIETNLVQISSHDSNSNLARTGAVASYLMTSNSKSESTRNLGQLAAIGGVIYSNNQKNKSNQLHISNLNKINQVVALLENSAHNFYINENNPQYKNTFIQAVYNISNCLNNNVDILTTNVLRKHMLLTSNREIIFSLDRLDAFNTKIRLNNFISKIDRSVNNDFLNIYKQKLDNIDKNKLKTESIYITIFIIFFILIGILLMQNNTGIIVFIPFLFSSIIYFWHKKNPLFYESKKLRSAVLYFTENISK